jgi:catechol 2,3-dioxygenase-like lactoylglutathione lyase family enzyme
MAARWAGFFQRDERAKKADFRPRINIRAGEGTELGLFGEPSVPGLILGRPKSGRARSVSLDAIPLAFEFVAIDLMERAIPILPTEDLTAAKTFYVDGLGFKVTFEASDDGRSGLLGLERGTIQLTLDSPMDGHGRNACVSLQVDDADIYYREWSAKVAVLRGPKDEDWGARTFDLLDPSGNTLFVMGPIRTRETH